MLLYPAAFAYGALALDVAVVVGSQLFKKGRTSKNLLLILGVAGAAGFLLYAVVPATGPRFVFPDFPQSRPNAISPGLILVDSAALRNAVPSLHFTWALLLLWMARNSQTWVRWIAMGFAILTFVATMALGQHYLVDLVIALPFTVATIASSERFFRIAATGGAMLATWLIAFRFFAPSVLRLGIWNWMPVIVTVVSSGVLLNQVCQQVKITETESALRLGPAGAENHY